MKSADFSYVTPNGVTVNTHLCVTDAQRARWRWPFIRRLIKVYHLLHEKRIQWTKLPDRATIHPRTREERAADFRKSLDD